VGGCRSDHRAGSRRRAGRSEGDRHCASGGSGQRKEADITDTLIEAALGQPRGRVRDLAGPEIRDIGDLARSYLRVTGKHRPLWTVKPPGKMFRALREGRNIARDASRGTVTFESWLTEAGHR
jgi:hypothetical protein